MPLNSISPCTILVKCPTTGLHGARLKKMQKIQDLELYAQVNAKIADVICSLYFKTARNPSKVRAARAACLFSLIRQS